MEESQFLEMSTDNFDLQRVIYIDLETTDLYRPKKQTIPSIIQFGAKNCNDQCFSTMITPSDPNFEIDVGS